MFAKGRTRLISWSKCGPNSTTVFRWMYWDTKILFWRSKLIIGHAISISSPICGRGPRSVNFVAQMWTQFSSHFQMEVLGHGNFMSTFQIKHGPRYTNFVAPLWEGAALGWFRGPNVDPIQLPFSFRQKLEHPIFIYAVQAKFADCKPTCSSHLSALFVLFLFLLLQEPPNCFASPSHCCRRRSAMASRGWRHPKVCSYLTSLSLFRSLRFCLSLFISNLFFFFCIAISICCLMFCNYRHRSKVLFSNLLVS